MPRKPRLIAAAGAALVVLVCSAPASARIIEIGVAPTQATPTCPSSPCLAVSRTTGYQTKVVDDRNTFVVPRAGRIVAWTVTLGNPDERQIDFFDTNYGAASARLTVLRRGERLYSRVVAQSPVMQLTPYFGQAVQFPLDAALPVKRGYMIALTVPTWAPALTQLLDDGSSWRASRPKDGCDDTESQTAQSRNGQLTQYRCLYRARLTYSATLITNPRPNPAPEQPRERENPPR
jgi:hypothetical protein